MRTRALFSINMPLAMALAVALAKYTSRSFGPKLTIEILTA